MKKYLASRIGLAAVLMVVFAPLANANPYDTFAGQTFEKAAARISSFGAKPVIRSRHGSYLPTEQCIVVGSKSASGGRWYLDLNCNDTSALNGHPGNSVATAAGKKAAQQRDLAKQFTTNYEQRTASGDTPTCGQSDEYRDYCTKICQITKACSVELIDYLGA